MDKHLGPFALPNFKGYFVVQFRKAFRHGETYGLDGKGERGVWAEFDTREGEQIEMRVGTSFIGIDQARANLKAEIPAWDFEAVRKKLHATWNKKLARVQVEGASEDQRHMVYTAIYHAMLCPKIFSEQGRGDQHALLHALRVDRDGRMPPRLQAEQLEQARRAHFEGLLLEASQTTDELQVLKTAEVRVDVGFVRHVSERRTEAGHILADVLALEEDVASARLKDAGDDLDRRRLAASVGAEIADDLARCDVEADAVDGRYAAIPFGEVLDREYG